MNEKDKCTCWKVQFGVSWSTWLEVKKSGKYESYVRSIQDDRDQGIPGEFWAGYESEVRKEVRALAKKIGLKWWRVKEAAGFPKLIRAAKKLEPYLKGNPAGRCFTGMDLVRDLDGRSAKEIASILECDTWSATTPKKSAEISDTSPLYTKRIT